MGALQPTRSARITAITVAFLIGIWAGRHGVVLNPAVLALVGIGLGVLALSRSPHWWFLAVCLAASVGVWRGHTTLPHLSYIWSLQGQAVTAVGRVSSDPTRVSNERIEFTLTPESVQGRRVGEPIRVYTNYQSLQRGYRVQVVGKPALSRGSARFKFGFGTVTVLSRDIGWLERFRKAFFVQLQNHLPGDLAGFTAGILVGARSLMPRDLADDLTTIGLSHLVAVSGANLTIIVQAVTRGFGERSIFIRTAGSAWIIFTFLLIAGMSASIVRAAMVSGLSLAALYYGVRLSAMTVICIPAIITAAYRPDYFMSDLGWQLSFLAFWSVLVLAPLVEAVFVERPNTIKLLLLQSTIAHAVTAPLVAAVFGVFSLVSPLANLIVAPLIPLAMLLGALTGIAGLVLPGIAAVVALPLIGLLAIALGLVQAMAGWPWASLAIKIGGMTAMGCAASILAITWLLRRRATAMGYAPRDNNQLQERPTSAIISS